MYDDNILRIRRPQSYYLAIKFIPPFSILVNNMWRGEDLHNSTLLVSSRVNNHCKFLWHTKALQMRSPLLSVLTSWPCQANYSTWMIPIKKKATGNFDLLCLCTSDQTKNRPHFLFLFLIHLTSAFDLVGGQMAQSLDNCREGVVIVE